MTGTTVDANNTGRWVRVVFASECDDDGCCPVCEIDYSECPCPGPCQEQEYEYWEDDDGTLWAMKMDEATP